MDDIEIAARFEKIEKDVCTLQGNATDTRIWQAENGAYIREIKDKMIQLSTDMKEMASKPQKRWDAAVIAIITSLVGGLIGYIIAFAVRGAA